MPGEASVDLGIVYFVFALVFVFAVLVLFNPDKFKKLGSLRLNWNKSQPGIELSSEPERTESLRAPGNALGSESESAAEVPTKDISDANPVTSPFLDLIDARDERNREKLEDAAKRVLEGADPSQRDFLASWIEESKYKLGDQTGLQGLKSLHEANALWVWPSLMLARISVAAGDFSDAKAHFEQGISRAKSTDETRPILEYAEHIEQVDGVGKAIAVLKAYLKSCTSGKAKKEVSNHLGDLLLKTGNENEAILFWYLSTINDENDAQHKFDIAYKLSKDGTDNLLAFDLYRALKRASPNTSFALNNYAAEIDSKQAPVQYVEEMFEAAKVTKIFSLANLSMHAAAAGFIQYANELLLKISAQEESEAAENEKKRLYEARSYILSLKEQSDEYLKKKLADAKLVSSFYQHVL